MMDAYAKAGLLKEAHETFDLMLAMGMKPGNDISDQSYAAAKSFLYTI